MYQIIFLCLIYQIRTYILHYFLFKGVNKNRKLVAFAEKGERPHVVVYDLDERKRKTILRLVFNSYFVCYEYFRYIMI